MAIPTPPPKRLNPITDDHGQPVVPRRNQPPGKRPNPLMWFIIFIVAMSLLPYVLVAISEVAQTDTIDLGGLVMPFIIVCIVIAVLIVLFSNIRVVPQANAYVIERLGKFKGVWSAGLHIKIPFIDRIANKVLLKEQVLDFEPQSVITKDNVSMKIDTVVYLYIVNPELYTYGVANPLAAIENLTATTLRNMIGELTLDDTLTSRDTVNSQMQITLDVATDPWGIKVTRVELKNIIPPRDIQEAMEKQMRAEREKREAILRAEGTKEARILEAAGVKEAVILEAEAAKQKMILEAEAEKAAAIARAEGHAKAIREVKAAEAAGIALVRDAGADDAVVRLKSLDALQEMAKGRATTIVVPSDIAGLAGTLTALKGTLDAQGKADEKV